MEVKVQISDNAYKALLANGCRMQGSIGLVSPTEGNFNEHRKWRPEPGTKYIKLPHGRASVGKNVRLTLNIGMDEDHVMPAQAIAEESNRASEFVDRVIEGVWEYPYGVKDF